ncbi:MAG: hypothetical protein ACTHK7_16890 [Aureliella sp.]
MRGLRPKFGVGLLVLITLWVAGYLAGLRYGSGELQRMRDTLEVAITTRTYDVADLVTRNGAATTNASVSRDLKSLCTLIEKTIDGGWDSRLDVSLSTSSADRALVVTQTGACHAKIEALLADLRSMARNRN